MSYWSSSKEKGMNCLAVPCRVQGSVQDFTVLMTHHIVTIALLIICYAINMVPIGLVIAVLHDLADVFLEVCEL